MNARANARNGFTLLELLIVVIIIGILASVAVPQFGKAARKARASEAISMIGAVLTAELAYYQEMGLYQNNNAKLSELIVGIPPSTKFAYALSGTTSNVTITGSPKLSHPEISGITVIGTVDPTGSQTITVTGL